MNKHFLIAIFFIISFNGFAQIKWTNPLEENHAILEGRLYHGPDFARLPPEMEQSVRSEVWNLSRQSAGLSLIFTTISPTIMVEYTVSRPSSMPHMPATGVSGVDLYAMDMHGKWDWVKGNYSFKDTIRYEFTIYHNERKFEKFRLFLPLYNQVENLRIGVVEDYELIFSTPESKAPIIVYGTSIAQGACASRPAMAWTNVLKRRIDYPLINLGFSGNGLLEKELIEFIAGHEASLYVLDCLPNLVASKGIGEDEIRTRLRFAVNHLKSRHPQTPVLLTAHAGYADGEVNPGRKDMYMRLNVILEEEYNTFIRQGISKVYLLSREEIGLSEADFVDGTHPTDGGMVKYAEAYRKKIDEIGIEKEY